MKYSILLLICSIFITNYTYANPPVVVSSIEDGILLQKELSLDLIVIFTAEWCGYCTKMKNEISNDMSMLENKIICYVDIDKNKLTAREYGVSTIPDSRIIKDAVEHKKIIGYKNKNHYINTIKQ
jgi:thiol-disulfide isomerase/thioredoxin